MIRSLSGRTVVLTRPKALSLRLSRTLEERGAKVVCAPLIRTVAPRSFRALDEALGLLDRYETVVFASANAVDFFFARAEKILGKKPKKPRWIAAVGPATAKALSRHGWTAGILPEDSRSEGLAKTLKPLGKNSRVLIPRAERGREALPRLLRAAGMKVRLATAYRTLADRQGRKILRHALSSGADAVCFASPSAVASAASALGGSRMKTIFQTTAAVAIGPTTAAALRGRGVRPASVSKRPDAESFAKAVLLALKTKP